MNENTLKLAHLSERHAWAPLLEASGMAVFAVLWFSFAWRLTSGPACGPISALFAILCGVVVSDAMSGFLHWFFDTFLEETTPIIGLQLVAPFREHHRDPLALTRHGFLELNGNSCVSFLPFMTAVWWFGPVSPQTQIGAFGYLFVMTFCFALAATNQLHSWAHNPAPPLIARALQRTGIALSPEHHARHHAPPHRLGYCVTNGWVNNIADSLLFFTGAERVLIALGVPRKNTE